MICGHIHYADMHERLGIHYINTGDWVESATAVGGDAGRGVRADQVDRCGAGARGKRGLLRRRVREPGE